MTSGQKIAFSLLAALCLFAVFVLSLNSRLFKTLETRFYAQAKIEENTGQLDKISESCDSYISEILSLIEKGDNAWAKNASVRSYYVQNPSESDVNVRRRLTEGLFEQIPALTGIRIVDKNGRNVHYSSFDDTDLLKQNGISKIYKNYTDIVKDADEIPYELLQKLTDESKSVLLCDDSRGRLILTVPFCWMDGIYSGDCLFYLNVREIESSLSIRNELPLGLGITLFADDDLKGGFVLNLPYGNKKEFKAPFLNYWKKTSVAPEKLLELPDGRFYVALSSSRAGKIRVSSVYTSDVFEISKEVRLLIYIGVFISILLIVFLIFSLFRDPLVTLQKRIKKVQLEIIQNYLDDKNKKEWGEVAHQLRLRKKDLSEDIIKSLHVHSKKQKKELSEYLDKNWDEIFEIFDSKAKVDSTPGAGVAAPAGAAELTGASIAEIRRMLEEVLQNRPVVVTSAPVAAAPAKATVVKAPVEDVDEVEELDDVEEVEEIEELAEDVEDLDEAEEVEEVEELSEDVDEVEELDDAEEVEELAEDVDEVEDLDDAEEVEELAEEVEDVEELAEEADDVETLDEVEEELDELPPAFDDSAFLASLVPPPPEYLPDSPETYFFCGKFPDVENLYGEELCLGERCIKISTTPIAITVYPLPEYEGSDEISEEVIDEPVEEAAEDDFIDADIIEEPIIQQKSELPEEEPQPDLEEVEEIDEDSELPALDDATDFLLAGFAENISEATPELAGVLAVPTAPENTIIEKDGVFSISENIEYTNVVQDPEFKELVDSIL